MHQSKIWHSKKTTVAYPELRFHIINVRDIGYKMIY